MERDSMTACSIDIHKSQVGYSFMLTLSKLYEEKEDAYFLYDHFAYLTIYSMFYGLSHTYAEGMYEIFQQQGKL